MVDTRKPHPFRYSPGDVTEYAISYHKVYYHEDDKETYGVLQLVHPATRTTFWMMLREYLSRDSDVTCTTEASNYTKYQRYMERSLSRGCTNLYYPISTCATTTHDRSDVPSPEVVVVSTDFDNDSSVPYGIVYHPAAKLRYSDVSMQLSLIHI